MGPNEKKKCHYLSSSKLLWTHSAAVTELTAFKYMKIKFPSCGQEDLPDDLNPSQIPWPCCSRHHIPEQRTSMLLWEPGVPWNSLPLRLCHAQPRGPCVCVQHSLFFRGHGPEFLESPERWDEQTGWALGAAPVLQSETERGLRRLPGKKGLRTHSTWMMLSPLQPPVCSPGLRNGSVLVKSVKSVVLIFYFLNTCLVSTHRLWLEKHFKKTPVRAFFVC